MTCLEFRRAMVDLVFRDLPPDTYKEAMDHVGFCAECAAKLREVRKRCGIGANDYVAPLRPSISPLVEGFLRELRDAPDLLPLNESDPVSADAAERLAGTYPVVALARTIIAQAINDGADTVHVEPTELGVRIRFRIDGELREVMRLPSVMRAPLIARIRSMVSGEESSRRTGRTIVRCDNRDFGLMVAFYRTPMGERLVMRLAPVVQS